MKKTTARTRQATPAAPKPIPIPPFAAAIAVMADPQAEGVPEEFTRAYALMPALVAAMAKGDPDDRWTVIRTIAGLDAAERTAERRPDLESTSIGDPNQMAHAIAILNKHDVDLIAALTTPIMDGAFMVGAAYACYVFLQGSAR
jgi:hypothetical protein